MDCTKLLEEMSMYIDNMLSETERIEFERHLEACEDCRFEFNNFKTMLECINEIEEIELPLDFEATLHNRLLKEAEATRKQIKFPFRLKVISGVAAAVAVVVIGMTALNQLPMGGGMKIAQENTTRDSMEFSDGKNILQAPSIQLKDKDFSMVAPSESAPAPGVTGWAQVEGELNIASSRLTDASERKIIKQGSLRIETDAFDAAYEKIISLIEGKAGYLQHSQIYYRVMDRENPDASLRSAYMTLRIPSRDFTQTFGEIKALGKMMNENIGGQDVTEAYRDMEREVANLEIQEERFIEILKKADKVEDILRIENELARVRSQINSLKANLNNYDKQVEMSTISLELEEVKNLTLKIQTTNDGVWKRAKNNFIKTINKIIELSQRGFVGLFGLIPALVILGAIGGPLSIYIHKQFKKRRN